MTAPGPPVRGRAGPGMWCVTPAGARALATSKEAPDTPLSPPPLNDEPRPATGHSG